MKSSIADSDPEVTIPEPPRVPIRNIRDYISQMQNALDDLKKILEPDIEGLTDGTALLQACKMSCVATIVIEEADQKSVKEKYSLELNLNYVHDEESSPEIKVAQEPSHGFIYVPNIDTDTLAVAISSAKEKAAVGKAMMDDYKVNSNNLEHCENSNIPNPSVDQILQPGTGISTRDGEASVVEADKGLS